MATIYKIELTSHWMNYSSEEIERKIKEALTEKDNVIQVKVDKQ